MESVKNPLSIVVFDALESEQYGMSFCRENGTLILNAMTVAMIMGSVVSVVSVV